MGIGIYTDKDSVYIAYRKQKNGQKANLKYFPGITTEKWDHRTKKFRDEDINDSIRTIELAINSIIKLHDPYRLTNERFTQLINDIIHPGTANNSQFFQVFDLIYEDMKRDLGERRAQTIRNTSNRIREFRSDITFNEINAQFYRELILYLEKRDFMANYIGSIIRDLKKVMKYAKDNKITANREYESFKKPKERVYNIYLNEEEIQRIYELNITRESILKLWELYDNQAIARGEQPDNHKNSNYNKMIKELNQTRKLFLVGCWTGLRCENYLSIDPDIQVDLERSILHAIANKNGPKLQIPLHWIVKEIFKEEGEFPSPKSSQKFNKHVKELGFLAGITEPVMYTRTVGGKRKTFVKPKYEMITSHTARRSLASNLILRGAPLQYAMAITGHETESAFRLYIGAVEKDQLTAKLKDMDIWKKPEIKGL